MVVNIVALAVIAVCLFFAVRGTVKHFRHEGGCCGGGSSTIEEKKKLTEKVVASKTVFIEGMKCDNCRINVQNCFNRIDGVSARVNLKKGKALLLMTRNVGNDEIEEALKGCSNGSYRIISIE